MDWKDIQGDIAAAAPVLGTLVGGPAGAAIGSIIASALGTKADPSSVQEALKTNPDAAVKLRQIEADQATRLQELTVTAENNRLVAETAAISAVNATMQVEAKAEHWLQWSWRPLNGYALALGSISTVIAVLYLSYLGVVGKDAPALAAIPTIVSSITMALGVPGAVCGVTAWFRGQKQNIEAAKSN